MNRSVLRLLLFLNDWHIGTRITGVAMVGHFGSPCGWSTIGHPTSLSYEAIVIGVLVILLLHKM